MSGIVRLLKDETGVTAIEYGLIAGATGLALSAIMPTLGGKLTEIFSAVSAGF